MKKMITRRSFLSATVALGATSLVACGSSDTSTTTSTSTSSTSSESTGDLTQQDPYICHVVCFGDGDTNYCNEIAAKISEITVAKYNTTVELRRIGWGSWATSMTLALTSGEDLDLFPVFGLNSNLATLAANRQVVGMTDMLLNGEGQEMYGTMLDEDLLCTTVSGEIYGIPMNRGRANVYGAACNDEIAQELGIDLDTITTLEEFEGVLAKVKAAYPNMYPLATNSQTMRVMIPSDTLGDDRTCVMGCITDVRVEGTTVENLYATEQYKEFVELMYSWQQKGYIMPDGTSNTDTGITLIGADKAFADFYTGPAPTTEVRFSSETGKTIKDVEFFTRYKTTTETATCWSVAVNSKTPSRAMQILNEIYMNPDVLNLFTYGIEGRTYEFVNDAQTIINYPAGVDSSNAGYDFNAWGWPNMLIGYVWEGYPEDLYDTYVEFNASAVPSPAYGFTFDASDVLNEYTACSNVIAKYAEALNCGAITPEGNLDAFNSELVANGIDVIVAEKQRQLDEWLATQA